MPDITIRLCLAVLAYGAALSGAEAADPAAVQTNCSLERYASYDLLTESDGRISIPMGIVGHTYSLMVDTGAVVSVLSTATVNALQLRPESLGPGLDFEFYGRVRMNQVVNVGTLTVGDDTLPNWKFLVGPDFMFTGDDGLIGANFLQLYDVDIDFAHGKFNLMSPDHCPGRVIYWTTEPHAEVPMQLDSDSHITIPVVLDGKSVTATVDTGAETSSMTIEEAKKLFNLDDNDPLLKPLGAAEVNGEAHTQAYTYPFKSMTFEGIAVQNPDIVLVPGSKVTEGAPPLLLGVSVLRQLHVYIAYHEKTLYLTAAEAK